MYSSADVSNGWQLTLRCAMYSSKILANMKYCKTIITASLRKRCFTVVVITVIGVIKRRVAMGYVHVSPVTLDFRVDTPKDRSL